MYLRLRFHVSSICCSHSLTSSISSSFVIPFSMISHRRFLSHSKRFYTYIYIIQLEFFVTVMSTTRSRPTHKWNGSKNADAPTKWDKYVVIDRRHTHKYRLENTNHAYHNENKSILSHTFGPRMKCNELKRSIEEFTEYISNHILKLTNGSSPISSSSSSSSSSARDKNKHNEKSIKQNDKN